MTNCGEGAAARERRKGSARRSEVLSWVEVVSEFLLGAYRRGIHGENWISAATIHLVHHSTPSPTPKAASGGDAVRRLDESVVGLVAWLFGKKRTGGRMRIFCFDLTCGPPHNGTAQASKIQNGSHHHKGRSSSRGPRNRLYFFSMII